MKYKQTLFLLFSISLAFGSPLSASIKITKPMLEGKVLRTQQYGSQLTMKFLPSSIKSFDGDIVFHFSSNPKDDNDIHSYRLIDGKLIYYGYDGSKHRMTLLSAKSSTWIMLETGLMNALGSIENLDGIISIADHEGNKLITMAELKQAYGKAVKKTMQFQRDNYTSEKERESDLAKLEELLIRSGSEEQKSDIKDAEVKQLKGTYRYYKKFLDNSSVWCMTDKDISQKKPLFYPKTFIIERLFEKYETDLSRSHNSYDPKELSKRAKKIEEKSQKIKYQFNRDCLYELRTKSDRVKNAF